MASRKTLATDNDLEDAHSQIKQKKSHRFQLSKYKVYRNIPQWYQFLHKVFIIPPRLVLRLYFERFLYLNANKP